MHQSLWGANIFTSPECYHVSRHSVQIHTHRCVPYDDSSWSQRNYCELAPALPVSCCYFCKETASVQSLFFLHFRFICRLQNTLYTCILGEMRQMDSDIWSAIRDLDKCTRKWLKLLLDFIQARDTQNLKVSVNEAIEREYLLSGACLALFQYA